MPKIYTKTGDRGETSLLGGGRVTKDCITMQVVGELDELNAALGVVVVVIASPKGEAIPKKREIASSSFALLLAMTKKIQRDLFKVGAEVAGAQLIIPAKEGIQDNTSRRLDPRIRGDDIVSGKEIAALEKSIDEMSAQLPELRNFILPGGSELSARLHLARAICRRTERALVAFGREQKLRPELYQYLNRLSDWLFTAARHANFLSKNLEIKI